MNVESQQISNGAVQSTQSALASAKTGGAGGNGEKNSDFAAQLQNMSVQNDKKSESKDSAKNETELESSIDGLQDAVKEINELNRTDENDAESLKLQKNIDDNINKREVFGLIDNNMNIQEQQDKFSMQTGTNMNFNSNGQPFAEFVNADNSKDILKASAKDLAEEQAILSTMEENIAIANKNMALDKTKIISDEQGIKRVNKDTNVTVDTIVSYDSIIMSKSDVEFFAGLIDGQNFNVKDIQESSKSLQVSKTLADLIAKSIQDNKPFRIDFDNNISVIIKIGRDGKISADFLPSSQVAEAYLRENLPILRQRFDDNNIEYGELNQRKQKQDDNNENRKKGRKDE